MRRTLELPKSPEDITRYCEIAKWEEIKKWQSEYYRKEGASSRRRHDVLYSEPFMIMDVPDHDSVNVNKEELESLLKV